MAFKEFYEKKLLVTAKTKLVYTTFGQRRGIPKNAGKCVEFRRYELFTPDTEALASAGQSFSQPHVEAEVKQRGAYVPIPMQKETNDEA